MDVIRLYEAFPVDMPALSFLHSIAEETDDTTVTTTSTPSAEPSLLRIRTPEYDESEYDSDDDYEDYNNCDYAATPIDLTEITETLTQTPPLSPPRDLPVVIQWRPPTPYTHDEPPVMFRQTAAHPRSEQDTIQFIMSQLPSPPTFSLSLLPVTPVVEWGVRTPPLPRSARSIEYYASPILRQM
jgi:hypothetical protein